MLRRLPILLVLPALLAAEPLVSGPQVGQKPKPYGSLVATGSHRGEQMCFICETEDKPAAVAFARKLTPELAKLLAEFDRWLGRQPADAARSWLTVLGEKTTTADDLAKWCKDAGLGAVPAGIYDDPDGPPSYKLNKEAEVTVILFVKSKVVANYALKAGELDGAKLEGIKAELAKLVKN